MSALQRPETFLWRMERVGKVTGSRVADIVARTKTGYSTSRANYLAQLVAERLTGVSGDSAFTSPAMQWGIEQEAKARAAYAFFADVDVALSPFVDHPKIPMAGASPDGLVGTDGLLELKCPNTATHLETVLTKTIPQKYQIQMLWQMACTGRSWCDFASFDPRLPEEHCLYVERLPRDDKRILELEEEVKTFLFELETMLRRLQRDRGRDDDLVRVLPSRTNLSVVPAASPSPDVRLSSDGDVA
jgi:putative phage-type endonuclease